MKKAIGVDIGGTYIKAGVVSSMGEIIKKIRVRTETNKGKSAVIKNIIKSIQLLMDKNISAIGIGGPGTIDIKRGIIVESPNLPLKNVPLKKIIKNKFNIPVFLDNDANCFALAEALYGAGKGFRNVIGLTIGTGLGGGIIIEKKIFHGKNSAGELGHITINFDGPRCNCGNYGCLESYVSVKGILRMAKGLNAKEPLDVYNLAKKGNKKAIKILEEAGKYLGVGITSIMNAFDPDIIVIGGQIADSWRFFNKKMNDEIKKRVLVKPCKVIKKRLKVSGITGAAAIAMDYQ